MFRKASIDDCMTVYQLICDMEAETLHYFRFQEIFKMTHDMNVLFARQTKL